MYTQATITLKSNAVITIEYLVTTLNSGKVICSMKYAKRGITVQASGSNRRDAVKAAQEKLLRTMQF